MKPLFDSAELQGEKTVETTLVLDRIEGVEVPPTLTVQINDAIREKQRKAYAKYNEPVFKTDGSREGMVRSDRTAYANRLVDLCVIDSQGIFEEHSNLLLKKVFVRQSAFRDYFLDLLTELFDGDLKIQEKLREDLEGN